MLDFEGGLAAAAEVRVVRRLSTLFRATHMRLWRCAR